MCVENTSQESKLKQMDERKMPNYLAIHVFSVLTQLINFVRLKLSQYLLLDAQTSFNCTNCTDICKPTGTQPVN